MPYITNFATNTTLIAKIHYIQKELLSITNLAAINSLNAKINIVNMTIVNISLFQNLVS